MWCKSRYIAFKLQKQIILINNMLDISQSLDLEITLGVEILGLQSEFYDFISRYTLHPIRGIERALK